MERPVKETYSYDSLKSVGDREQRHVGSQTVAERGLNDTIGFVVDGRSG